ncbi:MAG: class I SAM-dependent methyltransferase [Pseudomonadales bacterium]
MSKFFKPQQQSVQSHEQLQAWFQTEIGQQLLEAERRTVNRLLPNLFGYHLVEVSLDPAIELSTESLIGHRVLLSPRHKLGLPAHALLSEATELPFEHDSIDVVLLHHSLDFTDNPHQVLREATRVLRPGGHLVIVGFNPLSWWGVRRFCCTKRIRAPWQQGHFISHRRLNDWMSLLGLTELRNMTDFYFPPFVSATWRRRFERLQAYGRRSMPKNGAFMVSLARKDVEGMTRVKQLVFPRKFIRLPVRKAATRNSVK